MSFDYPLSKFSARVRLEMHLSFLPLLLLAWVIPISAKQRIIQNTHTSPADVIAGGRIYRSHCDECHGRDGTGGRGPDLTRVDVLFSATWGVTALH